MAIPDRCCAPVTVDCGVPSSTKNLLSFHQRRQWMHTEEKSTKERSVADTGLRRIKRQANSGSGLVQTAVPYKRQLQGKKARTKRKLTLEFMQGPYCGAPCAIDARSQL